MRHNLENRNDLNKFGDGLGISKSSFAKAHDTMESSNLSFQVIIVCLKYLDHIAVIAQNQEHDLRIRFFD